jgi:hypothetical protein
MRRFGALSLLALAACVLRVGPHVGTYEPATRAAGTGATLHTAASQVAGELLEVRDTAFVVLTASHVTLVPTRLITSMRFDDLRITQPGSLTPGETRQLRLLSRFPHGMPEDAQRRLLVSRQQHALRVVDR